MANVIKIKRGAEVPTTNAQLAPGEIGFNTTDDSLYMNKGTDTTPDIVRIGEDANSILTKVKTVDGASSGLDADLLDGNHASAFALSAHNHSWSTITSKPADNQFPNTAQAIGASQNLNNYTTPGFYYQSANANAASGSNYPIAQAGTLIVTKDAGTTQMYYHYNGSGIYYRTFYGSTWTSWQNILTPTWANVSGKPAQATRWPTWSEVTSKPSTFTPAAHNQAWSTISSKPAQATRWPSWSEVTGKPAIPAATTGTKSTSGYVRFDNGIKINWVTVTINANVRGKAFTWPSAFSSIYAWWCGGPYYDVIQSLDKVTTTGGTLNAALSTNIVPVPLTGTYKVFGIGV